MVLVTKTVHTNIEPAGRRTGGKARLMAAASELFAKGGYEGVSVSEVLDLSGLKAPSLYHHFGDKEGLYVEWSVYALSQVAQRVAGIEQTGKTLAEKLCLVVQEMLDGHIVDILQVQRDMRLLKSERSLNKVRAAIDTALYTPLEQMFREAMDSGEIRQGEPNRLAHLFVHATMSLHPTYRLSDPDDKDYTAWLVDHFVAGSSAFAVQ